MSATVPLADWRAWTVGLLSSRFICFVWNFSAVITLAFIVAALIYLFPTKLLHPNLLVANQLWSRLSHLVLRKGASPLKVAGQAANSREKRFFPMVIPGQGLATMAAAVVGPLTQFILPQRSAVVCLAPGNLVC